jgi:hypothetical protein
MWVIDADQRDQASMTAPWACGITKRPDRSFVPVASKAIN